jgi:hypothetical protein
VTASAATPTPTLPALTFTLDGQLDLACDEQAASVLNNLLQWLGVPAIAHQQLRQRYNTWMDLTASGGGGGVRTFVRAYIQLRGALAVGDRGYVRVCTVLSGVWGVQGCT